MTHPSAYLHRSYVKEVIPAHTGPPWSLQALETSISKGPHALVCTPEMTAFVWGEIQRRIKDGFNILLPAADAIRLFGEKLKISCITAVLQSHHHPRLFLDLLEKPYSDTPSVNESTDREATPESLQFGRSFPRILQAVWEADPVQDPFWVSNLDVTDAYHRGTIKPFRMGTFAYVIPSAPGVEDRIICINLVLPMGWLDSPNFFCMLLEILIDMANALVDTDLPVPSYAAISKIPSTGPVPPHTPEIVTHTYFYMDDIISLVQGDPYQQHQVCYGAVRSL